MDPASQRCKHYKDLKLHFQKHLEDKAVIDVGFFNMHLSVVRKNLIDEPSSAVADAALEFLEQCLKISDNDELNPVLKEFVNKNDAPLQKGLNLAIRRGILKAIDNGTFNIQDCVVIWKKYNIELFTTAFDKLCREDLTRGKCKKLFMNSLFPSVMNLDIENDIRNILIDISFTILPLVIICDLTDEEFEIFSHTVTKTYIKAILDLRDKEYKNWHKLWIIIIRFCNKRLHHSMSFTNLLLRVVEYAFRNHSCSQRLRGYDCWIELINNASLNPQYLSSPKQLKLLMTPLKAKFSKQEEVIVKRFEVFVHLLKKLREKGGLCLTEFMEFCFGHVSANSDPSKNGQAIKVQVLWEKVVTVLLEMLGHTDNCMQKRFNFDLPILNSENIAQLGSVLVKSVSECCTLLLSSQFENRDQNIRCLWESLFNLLNKSTDSVRSKCLESICSVLNGFAKDPSSDKLIIANIFFAVIAQDSKMNSLTFKNTANILVPIIFSRDAKRDYDSKSFKSIINYSMENAKNFKYYLSMFNTIAPEQEINLSMACDFWVTFSKHILLNIHDNEDHQYSSYLMWPIQYYVEIDNTKIQDVYNNWISVYKKITKDSDLNKIEVLDKIEALFRSNYSYFLNILIAMEFISENSDDFKKDFVTRVMDILLLLFTNENLEGDSRKKLCQIFKMYLNPLLTFYFEGKNDEVLTKMCQCLQIILTSNQHQILEHLANFLDIAPQNVKTVFASSLSTHLLDIAVKENVSESDMVHLKNIFSLLKIQCSLLDKIPAKKEKVNSPLRTINVIENVLLKGPRVVRALKAVEQMQENSEISPVIDDDYDEVINLEELIKDASEIVDLQDENDVQSKVISMDDILNDENITESMEVDDGIQTNGNLHIETDLVNYFEEQNSKNDFTEEMSENMENKQAENNNESGVIAEENKPNTSQFTEEKNEQKAKTKVTRALARLNMDLIETTPRLRKKEENNEENNKDDQTNEKRKTTGRRSKVNNDEEKHKEETMEDPDKKDDKKKKTRKSDVTSIEEQKTEKTEDSTHKKYNSKNEDHKPEKSDCKEDKKKNTKEEMKEKSTEDSKEVTDEIKKNKNKEHKLEKLTDKEDSEDVTYKNKKNKREDQKNEKSTEDSKNDEQSEKAEDSDKKKDEKQKNEKTETTKEEKTSDKKRQTRRSDVQPSEENKEKITKKDDEDEDKDKNRNKTEIPQTEENKKEDEDKEKDKNKSIAQNDETKTEEPKSTEKKKRVRKSMAERELELLLIHGEKTEINNEESLEKRLRRNKKPEESKEQHQATETFKKEKEPIEKNEEKTKSKTKKTIEDKKIEEPQTTRLSRSRNTNSESEGSNHQPKTRKRSKEPREEKTEEIIKEEPIEDSDVIASTEMPEVNLPVRMTRRSKGEKVTEGSDTPVKSDISVKSVSVTAVTKSDSVTPVLTPTKRGRGRPKQQPLEPQIVGDDFKNESKKSKILHKKRSDHTTNNHESDSDSSSQPKTVRKSLDPNFSRNSDDKSQLSLDNIVDRKMRNRNKKGSINKETPKDIMISLENLKLPEKMESEDIIESSQDTTVSITPISSPKKTRSSPSPVTGSHISDASTGGDTATPETDSSDLNIRKTVIKGFMKLDLPEKRSLTVSEKLVSQMDTVTLLSDQLSFQTSSKNLTEETTFIKDDLTSSPIRSSKTRDSPSTPMSLKLTIPTSPVTGDTPIKTKELLDDTLDISPICSQNEEAQDVIEDLKPVSSYKRLLRTKTDPSISPSTSKMIKMTPMSKGVNLKEEFDKEDIEDIYKFTRPVPSPLAVPKSGILKRKHSDDVEDDENMPSAKKKKVLFSDPSSSPNNLLTDFLDTDYSYSDLDTDTADSESSLQQLNALLLDNTKPIYPNLVNCEDDVIKVLKIITSPMVARVWQSEIQEGYEVTTVGQLASKTELEVNKLPLKSPVVSNVYKALNSYYFRKIANMDDSYEQIKEVVNGAEDKVKIASFILSSLPKQDVEKALENCNIQKTKDIEKQGKDKVVEALSQQPETSSSSSSSNSSSKTLTNESSLAQDLALKSTKQFLDFQESIFNNMSERRKHDTYVKLFKFLSDRIPENKLLELHIDFLKSIQMAKP